MIPVYPPLALKPAYNQSWANKLADSWEEGRSGVGQGEVETGGKDGCNRGEQEVTEEKSTQQEAVVEVMRKEKEEMA